MTDRCTDPGRHTWARQDQNGDGGGPVWWCETCGAPGRPATPTGDGSASYALAPGSVAADIARRLGRLKVEAETLTRERDEARQRAADLANEVMALRNEVAGLHDQLADAGLEVKR